MSLYPNVVRYTIDEHIEKYENALDMCENDCIDRMLNGAIIEELKELKDDLGLG